MIYDGLKVRRFTARRIESPFNHTSLEAFAVAENAAESLHNTFTAIATGMNPDKLLD